MCPVFVARDLSGFRTARKGSGRVVTLDDWTSAIYTAFLVEEEGTASSFQGIAEAIERHGLFCDRYTDRGSHRSGQSTRYMERST